MLLFILAVKVKIPPVIMFQVINPGEVIPATTGALCIISFDKRHKGKII